MAVSLCAVFAHSLIGTEKLPVLWTSGKTFLSGIIVSAI